MIEPNPHVPETKHLVRGQLQKRLLNPLDRRAFQLGIPPPGDALLETIGRRTGKPRLTPVCDGLAGDTFWIIAQHGRDSDWVRNIEADPRVRVNTGLGWRTGTAHILGDNEERTEARNMTRQSRDIAAGSVARTASDAPESAAVRRGPGFRRPSVTR